MITLFLTGPMQKNYLPDVALDSKLFYEFTLTSSDSSATNRHLVLQKKASTFFTQQDSLQSLSEQNTFKVSSINYPGDYPVGFKQTLASNVTNHYSLVTIQDLQLSG